MPAHTDLEDPRPTHDTTDRTRSNHSMPGSDVHPQRRRSLFAPIPAIHEASASLTLTEREQAEAMIGCTLGGKYVLRSIIGSGGFASVYEASHVALGRPMAVKVLHRRLRKEPRFREQFELEAMSVATLSHPNIVNVVDFGVHDEGQAFLVFELVRGRSLRALADGLPNRPEDALAVCVQILAALEEAHARGVVHRDLKPENVLLQYAQGLGETVKLIDFGIAALESNPDSGLFRRGAHTVAGTPEYMSPEQASGLDVTQASDLYSVGIILYELLTGSTPFSAHTHVDTMHGHISRPVPRIGRRHGENLQIFDEMITCALAKDPGDRYASAAAFRQAMLSLREELAPDLSESQPGALQLRGVAPPRPARPPRLDDGLDIDTVAYASVVRARHGHPRVPASRGSGDGQGTTLDLRDSRRARRLQLAGGLGSVAALALGGWFVMAEVVAPGSAFAGHHERPHSEAEHDLPSELDLAGQPPVASTVVAVGEADHIEPEAAPHDVDLENHGQDLATEHDEAHHHGDARARALLETARAAYRDGEFHRAFRAAGRAYAERRSLRALNLMRDAACAAGNAKRARYALRFVPRSRHDRYFDACAERGLELRSPMVPGSARALPDVSPANEPSEGGPGRRID